MKYIKLTICLLTITAIHSKSLSAQDCTTAYNTALNYYYAGQYDYVPGTLQNCIANSPAELAANLDLTFRIYKLLITSYQRIDLDENANIAENNLKQFLLQHNYNYSSEYVQGKLAEITF